MTKNKNKNKNNGKSPANNNLSSAVPQDTDPNMQKPTRGLPKK